MKIKTLYIISQYLLIVNIYYNNNTINMYNYFEFLTIKSHWQCGSQGFESPMLHHKKRLFQGVFFMPENRRLF